MVSQHGARIVREQLVERASMYDVPLAAVCMSESETTTIVRAHVRYVQVSSSFCSIA